jgi:hypothetical protein
MGHTVGERSWNTWIFCVFSVARFVESVLRLAVRVNSISGRVVRSQRCAGV